MDAPAVFTSTDATISSHWGERAPRPDLDPDDFGVRWTGNFTPQHAGTYRLGLIGTMKFQLYLNDTLVFRSEEHTSELQSHSDLVCRLLLEKKTNRMRS